MRFTLLICIFLTLLVGCTTLPEPKNGSSTLTIGRLAIDATGFAYANSANVNGRQSDGIQCRIVNRETFKVSVVTSGFGGYFFTKSLEPGEYEISWIYYKNEREGSWTDLKIDLTDNPIRFVVLADKVNVLGAVAFSAKASERHALLKDREYESTAEFFHKVDADKKWAGYEIVATALVKD